MPVLTELYHHPSSSVGVLYISPLKALINDQFKRLDDLLAESNLPVCKWHGDASQAEKNRLLKHPEGILQITPESLESLLIHKRGACVKLFYDLRFVIIDEVHYFMRDVRGVQVLCLLERLQRLAGVVPRRIGLSATLGDLTVAQSWLNSGTGRSCAAPVCGAEKQKIRLLVQRFQRADQTTPDGALDAGEAAHYEYLYRMTLDRKTILFTNSREETELVMAHLRQLALKNKTPDVYRVHHGNISAVLREQAEDEMKSAQEKLVTGATVTLELGIDIGSLDQVVQVGTPATVFKFCAAIGPLRPAWPDSTDFVHFHGRCAHYCGGSVGADQLELFAHDRHHRIVYKAKVGGAPHAGPVSVFNALSSNDELSIIRGRGHGAGADGCCPAFILFSRDPTGGLPHPTPAFAFDRPSAKDGERRAHHRPCRGEGGQRLSFPRGVPSARVLSGEG